MEPNISNHTFALSAQVSSLQTPSGTASSSSIKQQAPAANNMAATNQSKAHTVTELKSEVFARQTQIATSILSREEKFTKLEDSENKIDKIKQAKERNVKDLAQLESTPAERESKISDRGPKSVKFADTFNKVDLTKNAIATWTQHQVQEESVKTGTMNQVNELNATIENVEKETHQLSANLNTNINAMADKYLSEGTEPPTAGDPLIRQQIVDRMAIKQELADPSAQEARKLALAKDDVNTIPLYESAHTRSVSRMNSNEYVASNAPDIARYFASNIVSLQDANGKDLMENCQYPVLNPNLSRLQRDNEMGLARFAHVFGQILEHQNISPQDKEAINNRLSQLLLTKQSPEQKIDNLIKEITDRSIGSTTLPEDSANKVLTSLRGFIQSFINTPATSIKKGVDSLKFADGAKVDLISSSKMKSILVKLEPEGNVSFKHEGSMIEKTTNKTKSQMIQESNFGSFVGETRCEVRFSNELKLNTQNNQWESTIQVSVGTPLQKNSQGELEATPINSKALSDIKMSLARGGYDVQTHFTSKSKWA